MKTLLSVASRLLAGKKVTLVLFAVISVMAFSLWHTIKGNWEKEREIEAAQASIQFLADEYARQATQLEAVQTLFQDARNEESANAEIFAKHDMQPLLEEKPGLVAARATAAFNSMFNDLNETFGGTEDKASDP